MSLISNFVLNVSRSINSSPSLTSSLSNLSHLVSQVAQQKIESIASLFAPPSIIPFHGMSTNYAHQFPSGVALNPDSLPIGPERDRLLLWNKLSFLVNQPAYLNSQDHTPVSEQFANWLEKNQAALYQVTELDLRNCELTTIPPQITGLKNLRNLDLSDNKISEVPSVIKDLETLEYLNLSHNQLRTLPPEIGELSELETLNVASNALINLPQEIINLKSLQVLNIKSNQLKEIPSALPPSCQTFALWNPATDQKNQELKPKDF